MNEDDGEIISDPARMSRARPLLAVAPGILLSVDAVGQIREFERLRVAAREVGRRDGIAEVIGTLTETLQEAVSLRETHLREAEDDALVLALAVAERILQRRLATEPALLRELVVGVRESMAEARRVELVAGPRAYAMLERLSIETQVEGLTLTEGAGLAPWHLQMRGAAGELEFGLESQLRAVEAALRR